MSSCHTPNNASTCTPSSDQCSTTTNTGCEPAANSCSDHSGCCPVEMSIERWSGAFCQAMTEVQVDVLKEKIKKAWGPQMDKVGDTIVEAMGVKWHNMLTGAKSQLDLRDKIKDIFVDGLS